MEDKFIMLHAFDGMMDVNTNKDGLVDSLLLRSKIKLFQESKEKIENTIQYLENKKKKILECGKCGKAYWNNTRLNSIIDEFKQAVLVYDIEKEKLKKIGQVESYVLEKIDSDAFILQKDVFKVYEEVDKSQVANIIKKMVTEGKIEREKSGNTYKLMRIQ